MTPSTLVRRGLAHHIRVHLAVVAGVATAVAVLGGALLVGDSVRASLRALALQRLGGTHVVVRPGRYVREMLADDVGRAAGVRTAPLLATRGTVTEEAGGRRAARVDVYGVDDRFWSLHGLPARGPHGREALASAALAEELGAEPAATLLVTVERPSAIPSASLFGRRDDLSRTLRVSLTGTLGGAEGGEFALDPRQQAVHAVFVPLALLQRTIDQPGRVDAVLVGSGADAAAVAAAVRAASTLEDLGLRVRTVEEGRALAVESESGLVDDALARAAADAAAPAPTRGVLTYLANSIRAGERAVPYSVVAGVDPAAFGGVARGPDAIVLNDWAARRLGAKAGDRVSLDYYLWREEGRLENGSTEFTVAAVVPMAGLAGDPDLVPEYPGITTSAHLSDWDPPFPLDLGRVGPEDEEYWTRHRATPKAFVDLDTARRLWGHRLGSLTSVRIAVDAAGADSYRAALRARLDPLRRGFAVDPARERALASSHGATDFGEYFTYFSAFLVAAALLLAALFFRLGLEQRASELGLLRAVGFTPAKLRVVFLAEAAILSVAGAALGMLGALAWARLLVAALGTWWVDAVGTRALSVHVSARPLVLGAAIGIACALLASAWTLRDLGRLSPRRLLTGAAPLPSSTARGLRVPALLAAAAVALGVAAGAGRMPAAAAFFGSALLLLAASLLATRAWLGKAPASASRAAAPLSGAAGILWLGMRGARFRPGRSVLCVALIAFATFVVVAVGTFRRDGEDDARAGGGYALVAETLVPLAHDLSLPAGRSELGLDGEWPARKVARFHLKDGDDASCLNLYAPRNPRVAAPEARFLAEGGFRFSGSLASTAEEKANPWLLLAKDDPGVAAPAIVDAASMEYVLHRRLGDEIVLERPGSEPVRLRIVAALADSVFQSEVLVGEAAFRRLFPAQVGYRMFLIDVPRADEAALTARLETALADQGFDATAARDRLAAYHRVENTYLSTFQALGGLGLVLGTAGLATVLLRNALERRKEIALLRALGYRPGHVSRMLVAENATLLVLGVASGIACALVAAVPAAARRGGAMPLGAIAAVAAAVIATGLVTSVIAAGIVRRSPLLPALRSE